MRMKKSLGQNFLVDSNIIRKIIARIPDNTSLLEIGTGSGNLTEPLAQYSKHPIITIETDSEAFNGAEERLGHYSHVRRIHADFLDYNLELKEPVVVVANIPYYITTPIIEKCFQTPMITDIYLMVQKEIADRILAEPGSRDYSSLSIFCQTRSQIERCFHVSKNCFYPRPKVDSTFIRLTPDNRYMKRIENEDLYNRIVRSAFWGKRKTLLKCLTSSPYVRFDRTLLASIFENIGLKSDIRGQMLSVENYIMLANELGKFSDQT